MGSSRQSMLTSWLTSNSFDKDSISVLSADASFRQYYRATKRDTSYAVMDCPPEKENLESFLLITEKLKNAKLNVPEIFEVDREKGFLVMTDLGDNLYSKKQYAKSADAYETLIQKGVRNGYLFYNLGNAYIRMGETGSAILNYVRAKSLIPRDENLAANLKFAIQQTQDKIEPPPLRTLNILFFWVNDFSLNELIFFSICLNLCPLNKERK